ncbi:DUF6491 family protein [Phenylobacterium sp.]|uniref:DUF6491 family protein n=1 Tax=Phenylobacterium sp. TaxID=1871053 RepID=UPI0025FDB598|nr:DUF6491 family protein [Phenylobacterium sp.]MBX3485582.1 hypothetical protein [Phenylobacterium sp.]MCW5758183.1 hypothetical protein [Phenylobacterium sp.]
MTLKLLALPLAAAGVVALTVAPAALARSPAEPAAAAKAPARTQCFWTRQINNFASDDDRVVNVRVGVKDVYQFEMFGRCDEVDWAQGIAVRSRGSSYICSGLDAEIIAPSTLGPHRCPVRTVRKLSDDEIKALPKRARP